MDRETLLDLIPAYTLGALDADERATFEAWLATDPEAQRLLAEYQAVAASLVLTAPSRQAPAHLQADLRRRLAEGRGQTPPRRRTALSIAAFWRPLAAVAILVLVAAAILFWSASQVVAPNDEAAQLFETLVAQENVRRIVLTPGDGQDQLAGELVSDGTRAVIQVWQLPALRSDQAFELWLVDDSGLRSAGLVKAEASADKPTYILLPLDKPLDAYQAFGVSIEPEGGSPEPGPTGPRVFGVSL